MELQPAPLVLHITKGPKVHTPNLPCFQNTNDLLHLTSLVLQLSYVCLTMFSQ